MITNNSIIRIIRNSRGISQKELGDLIGSQSMISRIENNQTSPTDYNLQKICNILNIPIDDYFNAVFGKKKQLISNQIKIRTSILQAR
ncbi:MULTISPECIES: helix-turn-helix domain-containing protein [Leuconostoc]|uniref:helix-turn-helix domain-containing protein n=1 Tax=Leuconostoc TaxID=1243 RepID=UPI000D510E05|nr:MULTISPECIES: helix-turn-helix transcriptional regulator [Leuconostoc]MDV8935468.1 helix-turn-helix transcriptional regulator [Leuconostoc sp.]WLC59262.1 helix-turn-helix transcriptional regulator [Leuconostoc carnosum]WLC98638.1 helix-turn-helix transcriptional regulator [Leuconostoc carnosum]SPJ42863.1 Transcriptional activator [Leuconostoc carnosum]SPO33207.1 Transcriptional activator [Leuconostoc carnosum]